MSHFEMNGSFSSQIKMFFFLLEKYLEQVSI